MVNFNSSIMNSPIIAYAHHKIILDNTQKPIDYEFLEANKGFEKLTGVDLDTLIGHRVREVFSGIEHSEFDWISYYGKIAITGGEEEFDKYFDLIDKWYHVHVLSNEKMYFTTLFVDITSQKRIESELINKKADFQKQNELLSSLLDNLSCGVFMVEAPSGKPLLANSAAKNLLGKGILPDCTKENLSQVYDAYRLGSSEAYPVEQMPIVKGMYGEFSHIDDMIISHPDGLNVTLEVFGTPIFSEDGDVWASLVSFFDITERKIAEEKLRVSERTYREIFDSIPDSLIIHDVDTGEILDVNISMLDKYGYKREEVQSLTIERFSAPEEPYTRDYAEKFIKKAAIGETVVFEWLNMKKNGELFYSENILKSVMIAGKKRIMAIVRDISDRKKREEEKQKLMAQLIQAQKMESVGRLAGGVAHDFNNMLGIIMGFAELALAKIGEKDPLFEYLSEILKVTEHSADLTRQLLAFARKQPIQPRELNINNSVEEMLKILKRLLGEDIDLIWKPGKISEKVLIDPTQVEQILANLCVNARDAIAGVGKVTIETESVILDKEYCSINRGFVPGKYVMLAVSDDGCGMSNEVKNNIFEPFFTTKGVFKGTGLGLSTVYGIVKQNQGFINVYSELNQGTTFRVYLTQNESSISPEAKEAKDLSTQFGNETILLVEDEQNLLKITCRMLNMLGYTVFCASSPSQAIKIIKDKSNKIDLLLTDVVMPEMNGKDLSNILKRDSLNLKVLYTSGYTANVIVHHCVLEDGVFFLQKPFSLEQLSVKIREVLGS
ncbi:MAG: PAS domain S-box protein [Spirochaetales bacterium]|nr:PAS domain S-box protein [Spirochaetales bacterium]